MFCQMVSHRSSPARAYRQRDQELLEHALEEAAAANGHRPSDPQGQVELGPGQPGCEAPRELHPEPHVPMGPSAHGDRSQALQRLVPQQNPSCLKRGLHTCTNLQYQ
jgi:hypothetical protein